MQGEGLPRGDAPPAMSDEADVVWQATVDDGAFRVTVIRDPLVSYNGDLVVSHVETGAVILAQSVGLSYGAVFGPDVSDVAAWQVTSLDAIDAWLAEQMLRQENEGGDTPA